MRTARFPLVLAGLALTLAAAPPGDLSRIKRTIVKEPAYRSKPKYCLLVFGHEARSRIWLVLDGETLYVDRNGNGDLTEKDERAEKLKEADAKLQQTCLYMRNVPVPKGKATIELNQIIYDKLRNNYPVSVSLSKIARPGDLQRAGSFLHQSLAFADRPQDAPILHFDGPRQMQLAYIEPPPRDVLADIRHVLKFGQAREPVLTRGQDGCELYATMGTPGLGKGSFVAHAHDGLPKNVHPVAGIEFPPNKPGAKPIKKNYRLTRRC
jgi:hypothetical protein